MKNKKLLIWFPIITILIIGIFVYIQKRNEWKPTKENLTNYEAVYHEYPVIFLRKALDAYVGAIDGKVVNESCIMSSAIDSHVDETNTIKSGLASFDLNYYKDRFIVWWYEDNPIDGKNITILFKEHPDRLFLAWVGRDSNGEICLKGFNSDESINKWDLQETVKALKPPISDNKYGI